MFDRNKLAKFEENYSPIKRIEIIQKYGSNTLNSFNIFWNIIERKGINFREVKVKNTPGNSQEVGEPNVNNHSNNESLRVDHHPSLKDSDDSSFKVLNPLEVLENKKKQIEGKIKERGLYRKWPRSDTWACPSCNDSGDKWHMLDHFCKKNKKEINNIFWN